MNKIKEINDIKKIIQENNWKIFGIGGLPETRSEGHFVCEDFELVCSRVTGELESVKKKCKVNVFEIKNNSKRAEDILSDKAVQEYINSFNSNKKIAIYLFKSSSFIEEICRKNKWRLMTTENALFNKLNTRDYFFGLMKKIGRSREFEILEVDQLLVREDLLFEKFGKKFVIQTFNGAGGNGTFFVDRDNYKKVIKKLNLEGHSRVLVNSFIEGSDIATTGCVTRHNGIVSGFARNQFVGIKEAVEGKEDSEHSFCGNDWRLEKENGNSIQRQSEEFIQKIGEILKKEGYVGIFGVDFIYNSQDDFLVPLEINPRLIGSYPIETQFEVMNNQLPLVGFHFLDFLGIDYKIFSDFKLRKRKELRNDCSHIMMTNFFEKDIVFQENLKGGVYRLLDKKIVFMRDGFELSDIENLGTEFILTAGVPNTKYLYKKNNQLVRVLWKKSIIKCDWLEEVNGVKNLLKSLIQK